MRSSGSAPAGWRPPQANPSIRRIRGRVVRSSNLTASDREGELRMMYAVKRTEIA